MRPAVGAGESALENAAEVGLGDATPVVPHTEHHMLVSAARPLDAGREAQLRRTPVALGHRPVAHGVVDELPQDEGHPLGVAVDPEVLLALESCHVDSHVGLDKRARTGLHGIPHKLSQVAATKEVVLGHRGAPGVVERVLDVRLHARDLAREGPGILAASVREREVHRGKRGLYLMDPQLDVAAVLPHLLLESGAPAP